MLTNPTLDAHICQVGHLINQYTHSNPVVYNYAVGGHTLKEYAQQILKGFLDGAGTENSGVSWTAENSLFSESELECSMHYGFENLMIPHFS